MEHSSSTQIRLFKLFYGFILLCMGAAVLESATLPSSGTSLGNETDRMVLLDFKKRISEDPFHIMRSWNDSIHFCSWAGVTCNRITKRVLTLELESQKLVGSIPPSIGNLTFLTGINLRRNNFDGELPQELGRLQSLQHLNLSVNSFSGKIPTNISHCTQLRVLELYSNKLIGPIPDQLSSLLDLNILLFDKNNLTGTIPSWIGNFSSLCSLYIGGNNFQGSIPKELGRLTGLQAFSVAVNNLSGMVPSSIYNISSISIFGVSQNQLRGELPPNVGFILPNLEQFHAGGNKFTGNIPASFSNASRLRYLNLPENDLTGTVPGESLGRLRSLVGLNFGANRLGTGKSGDLNFISFLANCTSLEGLALYDNQFRDELPSSISNLSTQLTSFTMEKNLIYGSIDRGIGNLVNLTLFGVSYNFLIGKIPEEIGRLQKLGELYLNDNKFYGPIPSSLGNLTSLTELYVSGNRFEGSIPPTLANCQRLLALDLSRNNLTGPIPQEVIGISSLSIYLLLSNNYLTGSLPAKVSDLANVVELDVSGNNLSGEIPTTLGNCIMLERLYLENNKFEGTIPQSLKSLRSLEEMDISSNNFSGQIPEFMGKLSFLKNLNVANNNFQGELPKEGIFLNASGLSILRNGRLCGGIPRLSLPPCSNIKAHSSRGLLVPKVVIPAACALASIIALSCFIITCSMSNKPRGTPVSSRSYKDWKSGVSYKELVESTNRFSRENLIGSGSFGSVYKGVLPSDGIVVAVKVLNLQQQGASNSFIRECEALRSVRHRNLLKIITICSSIDNQGNDFKSLVYEYSVNGSLDVWLHPTDDEQSQRKRLSLVQRLNIAIDIGSALEYLHHHCETSIVHCDLKPSNVLLDEDMVAHIGDFGLAKFLLEAKDNPSQSQTMSTGLKGTIGYIPPEYGMGGEVSILGDVYSFGILLLEMFTGKRPTDGMLGEGKNIHNFTAIAIPDHVMDIVDPSLLIEGEDADAHDDRYRNELQENPITNRHDRGLVQGRKLDECLVSAMQIGLVCSAISPGERMHMDVVVNKMKAIRDSFMNL
ncbi:probable LRR receptor-like serine/threonine-protein kinase At3g47570 [Pyrus x bretschneideri]|uniref:probable LRR receptor-like serine/threonine-protein kinase At3g47570 n=1 Tax=Pyrus x bretschneideri TaxID=225117 RepID=UPI00202FD4D7|nr:probable LRR receptor-like serine/threonine-protein kinase At3g47570 [Pyrus x bretschneideri]